MANARYYSSIAPPTTLTGGIGPSNNTIQVASTAGLPGSLPYTLSLDYGAANEELVDVTAVGGLTLTVTRGVDSTAASTHNIGAVVRHVTSARDFTDSRTHEASSSGVHGVTGSVVGTTDTQTLTNKTLTFATGSLRNVTIYNTGSNTTAVVGDSANPSFDRFWIVDNEISLNAIFKVTSNGNLQITSPVGAGDNLYRLRLTDSNGTTDRFAVFAGGTVGVTPTATTTFPAMDLIVNDTSGTKRSIRVAASGGGTERFTVWNDGHVDITGTSTAFSIFDVQGPASHASAYTRIIDGSGNTLQTIGSTGKDTAAGTMDVRNDFHTGGVSTPVLRVFGRNPGQTGDLQQWVDSSNTIQAFIAADGTPTFSKDPNFNGSTIWTSYTPTVTGGGAYTPGSATSGWYKKIGKIVIFEAYLTTNVAGTGTTTITVALPSTPFRDGAGAGTTRQAIPFYGAGVAAGTNSSVSGSCMAVILAGGSGAVIDNLRGPTDIVMRGEQLGASTILTIQGWYREA